MRQTKKRSSPRRRQQRSGMAIVTVVSLMLAHNVTPSQCFSQGEATTSVVKPSITRHSYTNAEDDYSTASQHTANFYNPLFSSSSTTTTATDSKIQSSHLGSNQPMMPTWLQIPNAHLVHANLSELRKAMLQTFFTENEILKVTYAIQEASNGNDTKAAGAAQFCLILVETMEMGLNALVAAIFHYCKCYSAREQQQRMLQHRKQQQQQYHQSFSSPFEQEDPKRDLSPWDFEECDISSTCTIESFGEHVVQIENDAARLKRLEMVASMVMQSPSNSHRVMPDEEGANNLRNLFLTESKDWRALAIRGAACLYRLQGILQMQNPNERLGRENNRVCREALRIYAPLASRLGMHRLKNELENTAFQILYPRQFQTVSSLLHQTRDERHFRRVAWNSRTSWKPDIGESMEQILAQVQAEMTEILQNDPEFIDAVHDFSVTARVKEAYSTWKKMLRSDFDHILQVPDAIAFRIVLNAKKNYEDEPDEVIRARERALCYYAQELCLRRWAPAEEDGRFKDYIAKPKANGYQSLHYTAKTNWQGQVWSMEIQVRSGEMHNVAEYGVASHWEYKTRGKQPVEYYNKSSSAEGHSAVIINEHFGRVVIQQNSDAYLRSLQEYHWRTHGTSYQQHAEPSSSLAHVEGSDTDIFSSNEESKLRAERIRDRTQRLAPYIEALTTAQSDLARENVFVFLSQDDHLQEDTEGAVLALPAGAVVLDVLRQVDLSFLPEECILHNGSPASLTSRLNNGDVLSIPSMLTTSMM